MFWTRRTTQRPAARRGVRAAVVTLAAVLAASLVGAAPAQAGGKHEGKADGTRSLAEVLAADGQGFDGKRTDFDILDAAVTAVLTNDPKSPVAVLADGNVPLTAFLPTDGAFKRFANDVLGKKWRSEKQTFLDIAGAFDLATIEAVLLYHVVPGATLTYRDALAADGAVLDTALSGATIEVDVKRYWWWKIVKLVDNDTSDRDAIVWFPNINKGNKQIAHGVTQVLRPLDLP